MRPSPLCDLPPEILSLVLHALDVGDARNRRDLGALAVTCKALKQSIANCSMEVKLRGAWLSDQLAGLCRTFPRLASIGAHPAVQFEVDESGKSVNYPAAVRPDPLKLLAFGTEHFEAILSCRDLWHLDLRFVESRFYGSRFPWAGIDSSHHMPQGLGHLALPAIDLPAYLEPEIDALTGLTSLNCLQTQYYPCEEHVILKWLAAGGAQTTMYCVQREKLCEKTLRQLTNLTYLHLPLYDIPLPSISAPPSLLELKLWGYIVKPALWSLLKSLPHLQSLELRRTYATARGEHRTDHTVKLPPVSTRLRKLSILWMRADVRKIPPANIQELHLQGWGKPLDSNTLAWLSKLTSIQKLDLSGWRSTPEMRVLGQLPIQEFVSDQGHSALVCMLAGPRALQHLEIATLTADNFWFFERDTPVQYQAAPVPEDADSLLRLPKFRLLRNSGLHLGSHLGPDPDPPNLGYYSMGFGSFPEPERRRAEEAISTVEAIVRHHPTRWECLRNEKLELVYRRV